MRLRSVQCVTIRDENIMDLTRRQFLQMVGGSATGAVLFAACGVPEESRYINSPHQMPEDLVTGLDNWYATLCRQCPTAEGLVVRVFEGRAKKVEGNVDYPINMGKHSARCEASLQSVYNPDRIDRPLLRVGDRGKGEFNEIGWSDALARITNQLQILQNEGKQNGLVMVTNPLSAHLGDVTQRFVSRFGGRHLQYETIEQTNISRAIKDIYSQEIMPDFDISKSNYILSFGADWLNTWTSPTRYMKAYGEFRQGKGREERGTLVHVDPRFSATAANADQWVPVNPGWEGILAVGIANVILSDGLVDDSIRNGLSSGDIEIIEQYSPEKIASDVGVSAEKIRSIAHEFASHPPALAIGGGSAAAHTNGLFNMKAVYWLNYLVGSVGVEGGVIFNPEPPMSTFSEKSASFGDFRNLSQEMSRGEISALMIRGADPWYGLPEDSGFRRASFEVPFIFAVSNFLDDTTAMADLILPEHDAFEDWGSDIPDPAPGYQLIGFQQPVVRPFYENLGEELGTKNFADIMIGLAPQLGLDLGLPGSTFAEILKAGAEDLWRENRGSVTAGDFDAFWYGVLQRGGWWDKDSKYQGDIPTISAVPVPKNPEFDHSPSQFPYHLIPFTSTGIGNGEGAFLPWLQATPDPITTATWQTWLEINVSDAEKLDISEGDVINVISASGKAIQVLAFPHPAVPPGVLSVPIGQGHISGGRYSENRGSNVMGILTPSIDEESGALAWASSKVRIEKTGEWMRVPKLENTFSEFPRDENQHIIKVTPDVGSDGH